MLSFQLCQTPDELASISLDDKTAVVVDVLRASTTITTALWHGAESVCPCVDIETARSVAINLPNALLGGERGGLKIDGFDMGNSPLGYTREVVEGRSVVFTTTNGTLAINASREARTVLIGSFVNLDAICEAVQILRDSVVVVCAGTDNVPTLEDNLFGGSLLASLLNSGWPTNVATGDHPKTNLAAKSALKMWEVVQTQINGGKQLAEILASSQGGQNLLAHGFQQDIEFASRLNQFAKVPRFNAQTGSIRNDVDLGPGGR